MSRSSADRGQTNDEPAGEKQSSQGAIHKNYQGFLAGMFSGIAKLSVGHPFDTIKVRLQTSDKSKFKGPLECVLQTVRNEGVRGLYKGASPPLIGWMFMDSVMLGSLTFYRRMLRENVFNPQTHRILAPNNARGAEPLRGNATKTLPTVGHCIAGLLAGFTVSLIAAPVEHIKARLQVQYAADKTARFYRGPIDCTRKIIRHHGIPGLYRGLVATLIFRSWFFVLWGSYDVLTRLLEKQTNLSTPSINFWAGGLSAQLFWVFSYPSDVVKQRIMTDPLGGNLGDGQRRFRGWKDAARDVWRRQGPTGYWRGFLPCFLRAFPANAVALATFEAVMRALPE